jgi:predicted enzyme related to lactoylglutathione lyase
VLNAIEVVAPDATIKVERIVPNIASDRFEETRKFYSDLFDVVVSVEHDEWYLQLMPPGSPSLNFGFLRPGHEFFGGRPSPSGRYSMVLTIHVDDVDEAYARAQQRAAEIVQKIRDEEYGQRHFLVVDPNGLLLNVMNPIRR